MAELLLLLAVLVVFAMIAVPIVQRELEKAYEIADMAEARSVYGMVTTEMMGMTTDETTPYYYDGAHLSTTRPSTGYGKSSKPFESFAPADFPVTVTGIPRCDGKPMYLMVKFNSDGSIDKMIWGGYPIVTTRDGYLKLTPGKKMSADKELLNSLQSVIRNMTYGELKALFWDSRHEKYADKFCAEKGFEDGVSFSLALSNLDDASGEVLPTLIRSGSYAGCKRNEIFSKKLFEKIGYNTDLKAKSQYLILSHEYDANPDHLDPLVIKVNLLEDPAKAKKKDLAEGAVVYLDGNGIDPRKNATFGYKARKDALED